MEALDNNVLLKKIIVGNKDNIYSAEENAKPEKISQNVYGWTFKLQIKLGDCLIAFIRPTIGYEFQGQTGYYFPKYCYLGVLDLTEETCKASVDLSKKYN